MMRSTHAVRACVRVLCEVEIDDDALNLVSGVPAHRALPERPRGGRGGHRAARGRQRARDPHLDSSRAHRQQGNGSVLLALLVELAVLHLNAKVVVVSATNESRRFWLSMGLHVAAHCPPPVSAVLRYLKAHGYVAMGFYSSTTQMAKALPPAVSEAGELVKMALQCAASKTTKSRNGLSAARVADVLGYATPLSSSARAGRVCPSGMAHRAHARAGCSRLLDLREAGSLARLVSVCAEAPNFELLLIPTGVAALIPAPLMPAPMPTLPPPAASTDGATAEAAEGDVPMADGAAPETG